LLADFVANMRNTLVRFRAQCGPIVAREGDSLRLHADTHLDAYENAVGLVMRLSRQTLAPDAYYAKWGEGAPADDRSSRIAS
jgi:hypothetical protein